MTGLSEERARAFLLDRVTSQQGWKLPEPRAAVSLETAAAAMLTFAAEQQAGGWRGIESAPKDGTPFLAFNPMVGVYNTAFVTAWDHDGDGYEGFPCGFWGSPDGKWDCRPTHWQPPPTPPTEEARHVAAGSRSLSDLEQDGYAGDLDSVSGRLA